MPIASAGRAALIILNLAFIRVEGASRLKRLIAYRPEPGLWLDDLGHLGVRHSLLRRAPAVGSWCLALVTLLVSAAWVSCESILLVEDFVADPVSTIVGWMIALIGWGIWRSGLTVENLHETWIAYSTMLRIEVLGRLERNDDLLMPLNDLDRDPAQPGLAATAVNEMVPPMLSEPDPPLELDEHFVEGHSTPTE